MKIEVHHKDAPSVTPTFTHVATITIPDDVATQGVEAALEYAWRWTNNINGSWSRSQWFDFEGQTYPNGDYNPNTEVLAPLPTYNGKTYGLRSSMMGDRFIVDGVPYECAMIGFEKVEG